MKIACSFSAPPRIRDEDYSSIEINVSFFMILEFCGPVLRFFFLHGEVLSSFFFLQSI